MASIIISFFSLVKLATILVFVLAIVWVGRHYRSRKNETSIMTPHEQTILDDLARIADKMERRLETLEKIIEADDPKWKERI